MTAQFQAPTSSLIVKQTISAKSSVCSARGRRQKTTRKKNASTTYSNKPSSHIAVPVRIGVARDDGDQNIDEGAPLLCGDGRIDQLKIDAHPR